MHRLFANWPNMNMINIKRLLTLVATLLPLCALQAQGIVAHPTKVEMSAKQRGSSVRLINVSNEDKLLRISFEERQMRLDGKLVSGEPGRWAASSLIRYSPRQILVPAGTSQTVRLLYRRRVGMADGQYRSHLTFQEIPLPGEVAAADKGGVRLNKINGFSIPVYVNQGSVSAALKPTNVAWKPGAKPVLRVAVSREGSASAYGRLEVVSGTPEQPQASLFTSRKFAVYKELEQRSIDLPLPAGIPLGSPMFVRVWTIDNQNRDSAPITLAVNR